MVYIRQNESTAAKRRVLVKLVDATDAISLETGVTSPTIYVSKNGGTPAAGAGNWAEIDSSNMPGLYYYELTQSEVNTLGHVFINVMKSGVSLEFTKEVEILDVNAYTLEFPLQQNEADANKRRILVKMVDETDCITPETGITSPTIQISKNGASPSAGAGNWVEIDSTNMPGLYYYELTQAEVDTLGVLFISIVKSGTSREFTKEIEIINIHLVSFPLQDHQLQAPEEQLYEHEIVDDAEDILEHFLVND